MFNISKAFLDGTFDAENIRWCFDRSAVKEAKSAEGQAGDVATQEQAGAQQSRAALVPFYRQEMQAQHLYTPQQTQELLGAAGAPIASSLATAQGQAASEAARTRNTSGFSAALDQAARDRAAAMGQVGAGVAAEDVRGAADLRQKGAAGLQGLYGVDTNAMLEAMGRRTADINAQVEAGKSGWFQNLMGGLNTLSGLGTSAAAVKKAF